MKRTIVSLSLALAVAASAQTNTRPITCNATTGNVTWPENPTFGNVSVSVNLNATGGNVTGGNVSATAITASGNITGNSITSNGSLTATTGNITNLTVTSLSGGNVVKTTDANVTLTGNLTAARFAGNGTGLTNLTASNLTTGTLPDARLSSSVIKEIAGMGSSSVFFPYTSEAYYTSDDIGPLSHAAGMRYQAYRNDSMLGLFSGFVWEQGALYGTVGEVPDTLVATPNYVSAYGKLGPSSASFTIQAQVNCVDVPTPPMLPSTPLFVAEASASAQSVTMYAPTTIYGATAITGNLSITSGSILAPNAAVSVASVTCQNISGNYLVSPASPSGNGTGTEGMIKRDVNYLYICTGTNTWKRVALSSF